MFFSYTEKPEGSSRDIGKTTVEKGYAWGRRFRPKNIHSTGITPL